MPAFRIALSKLIKSIARGRQWLDEIISGVVQDVEKIAERHSCSARHVNMTISMAFIAPDLVNAAVEGRLPRGIGVAALRDAPAEWSLQFDRLGLIEPSKSGLQAASGGNGGQNQGPGRSGGSGTGKWIARDKIVTG